MTAADRWSFEETAVGPRARELRPRRDGAPLTHRALLDAWRDEPSFRDAWTARLAASPEAAFFWELPPLVAANLDEPARCVLTDAPSLAGVAPEPHVFAREFDEVPPDDVGVFPNLGGDALLVVPRPADDGRDLAHLATFVRRAPPAQAHALWSTVGRVVAERVGDRALWVSTSGLGVAWLHVRLDATPKYYVHAPYRSPP